MERKILIQEPTKFDIKKVIHGKEKGHPQLLTEC